MDKITETQMKLNMQKAKTAGRLQLLEGIIADFLRLHLSLASDSAEEFGANMKVVSEKLLGMQEGEMEAMHRIDAMMRDFVAAVMEQANKAGEAPPPLAAVEDDG